MSGSAASIPLDVAGGGGPSSPQLGGIGSALGQIGQIAETSQRLNQMQQFQAQFAAKRKFGAIMAAAPDPETGMANASKDPDVAAFAGEAMGQYRQMQETMSRISGMQQEQNTHGLQAVMKAAGMAATDPGNFGNYVTAAIKAMPPEIAKRDGPAMQQLVQAWAGDNPDPATFQKRALTAFAGAGGTPEALAAATGSRPAQIDTGGFQYMGSQSLMPGGQFIPGTALGKTLPAQVADAIGPGGSHQNVVVGGSGGGITQLGGTSGTGPVAAPSPAPRGGAVGRNSLGTAPPSRDYSNEPNPLLGGLTAKSLPGGIGQLSPDLTTTNYNRDVGSDMAKYKTDLDAKVTQGNTLMKSIAEARSALQSFKPGAGAETYAGLGKIAQAFGANQALVDKVSNGDLSATQEFTKLMGTTAMTQLRQAAETGKITQGEFDTFQKANPNIETDPRATEKIFNYWSRMHGANVEEQKQLAGYTGQGGNVANWPAIWQDRQSRLGFSNPVQTEGGAALPPTGQNTTGPAATTQGAKPGSLPSRPDGVPAGSQYSPSRKAWRTPDGRIVPGG